MGPDLTAGSIHKDAAWMIQHFKRPSAMRPGISMPPIQLSDSQLNALAAFLLKLNARNATALDNAPDFAVEGALRLPGEPLRRVPHGERRRDEGRTAA